MMRANRFILLLILMSILLVPSCATLTRGDKQDIPVTSSPAGATVIVNGVRINVTPTRARLARKDKDQVIRIEYPGYSPFEIRVERSYSSSHMFANGALGWLVGGAVAGAWFLGHDETAPNPWVCIVTAIGGFLLIDVATHAGYTLTPKNLTVTLTKADGPARVDTMLIDADDFRNVKWIRIHGN